MNETANRAAPARSPPAGSCRRLPRYAACSLGLNWLQFDLIRFYRNFFEINSIWFDLIIFDPIGLSADRSRRRQSRSRLPTGSRRRRCADWIEFDFIRN